MTKILIEESVLRQALEALHRSIERMVFAEPWSAAEKDIDVAKKAIASMQSHLDAAENVEPVAALKTIRSRNDSKFADDVIAHEALAKVGADKTVEGE